jgi:hypothetical protein
MPLPQIPTVRTLAEQEQHLFEVISSQRFLRMEGLSNEVPFFIYPYNPADALAVAKVRSRIVNKLSKSGIEVLIIDLYDLSIEILTNRGVWDRILDVEGEQHKADFRELLQGLLDPEQHLVPAVRSKLVDSNYQVLFLTGVGEVFPYIRSHNVLNNLQSVSKDKPMLMFFPGEYRQSDTLGSSLELFGRLHDDQYYRAKNVLEQEV